MLKIIPFILLFFVYCFGQQSDIMVRQIEQNETFDNSISILSQRLDLANSRIDSLYKAAQQASDMVRWKEGIIQDNIYDAQKTLRTIIYVQLAFDILILLIVAVK